MNDMKCGNRLTQHGVGVSLEVFWTGRERRWGVRSLQSITKGDFVCIYAGEIVPIGCKCEHNCTNENCVRSVISLVLLFFENHADTRLLNEGFEYF